MNVAYGDKGWDAVQRINDLICICSHDVMGGQTNGESNIMFGELVPYKYMMMVSSLEIITATILFPIAISITRIIKQHVQQRED